MTANTDRNSAPALRQHFAFAVRLWLPVIAAVAFVALSVLDVIQWQYIVPALCFVGVMAYSGWLQYAYIEILNTRNSKLAETTKSLGRHIPQPSNEATILDENDKQFVQNYHNKRMEKHLSGEYNKTNETVGLKSENMVEKALLDIQKWLEYEYVLTLLRFYIARDKSNSKGLESLFASTPKGIEIQSQQGIVDQLKQDIHMTQRKIMANTVKILWRAVLVSIVWYHANVVWFPKIEAMIK